MRFNLPLSVENNQDARVRGNNTSRLVNLYPQKEDGGKNVSVLISTPACKPFIDLGTIGAVQGMHLFDGFAYAVSDNKLFQINLETKAFGLVGNLFLSGRIKFVDNGFQMVILDGITSYIYDNDNGLSEISSDNFYPSNAAAFLDQYLIFNRKGTGQFFISSIADGYQYDALGFATAESAPDDTIDIIENHGELWLFGERTIEVWYNSAEVFPFSRNQSAYIERGVFGENLAIKANSRIFWIGDDKVFYSANGYQPSKISNLSVDYDLSTADLTGAFIDTYYQEGHTFVILTIPQINKTWCYDLNTGLWHLRSHIKESRHLGNCFINYNGRAFCGDFRKGVIYSLDLDYALDEGLEQIERLLVTPPFSQNRELISPIQIELDVEINYIEGGILDNCNHNKTTIMANQNLQPTVQMTYSDDGWRSFQAKPRKPIAKKGSHSKRVKWTQLGQFRERAFEFSINAPYPIYINGLYGEA